MASLAGHKIIPDNKEAVVTNGYTAWYQNTTLTLQNVTAKRAGRDRALAGDAGAICPAAIRPYGHDDAQTPRAVISRIGSRISAWSAFPIPPSTGS